MTVYNLKVKPAKQAINAAASLLKIHELKVDLVLSHHVPWMCEINVN